MAKAASHSPPTALLSYSHDSLEHERDVLALCNRLRANGVDTMLDQFLPGAPAEGWPLWMERAINDRDYTLMLCTQAYLRRFMDDEALGIGRGVVWEARILRNMLYADSAQHRKIVPVTLHADDVRFVPTVFRGHVFAVGDDQGFEELLRYLWARPAATPAALGTATFALTEERARWSAFEQPWLVPQGAYASFFTGREALIERLGAELEQHKRTALCGLGGVGKTQTAIRYAVLNRERYSDGVFWTNAESTGALTTGFVEIARIAQLVTADSTDQEAVARDVLRWMGRKHEWLLILDNADDRRAVAPFIPEGKGHVLLTSRESVFGDLGIARPIEVKDLSDAEAGSFLLKRTGRDHDGDEEEWRAAAALAAELGNLPLALEQAAAYVSETNARFSDYLSAFRKRRLRLLESARPLVRHDTVATTWFANFDAVISVSPAAADILRVSAFLAPDDVPFEFLAKGAPHLGESVAASLTEAEDVFAVTELLRPLARYSLIGSHGMSRSFAVHRLVQEVIREAMDESERRRWIDRAIAGLNASFPNMNYASWTQWDRLLPHALSLANWIDFWQIETEASGRLLNRVGYYLSDRGRYGEALMLALRGLSVRERVLGPEHPDVAESLNSVAACYWGRGAFSEALPLVERALAITQSILAPRSPALTQSLNNLAGLYWAQGAFAKALPLCEQALAIRESSLRADDPKVASSLTNVAALYCKQGRYPEAIDRCERALAILERTQESDPAGMVWTLNLLARLRADEGRRADARAAAERALEIYNQAVDPNHPLAAYSLNTLGELHCEDGRLSEARELLEQALSIRERVLGTDHPEVATTYATLAELLIKLEKNDEAEALCERAMSIQEEKLGPEHPDLARTLTVLAELNCRCARYHDAEPLLKRAQTIAEAAFGPAHLDVAKILETLAVAQRGIGRPNDAEQLEERSLAIRRRAQTKA